MSRSRELNAALLANSGAGSVPPPQTLSGSRADSHTSFVSLNAARGSSAGRGTHFSSVDSSSLPLQNDLSGVSDDSYSSRVSVLIPPGTPGMMQQRQAARAEAQPWLFSTSRRSSGSSVAEPETSSNCKLAAIFLGVLAMFAGVGTLLGWAEKNMLLGALIGAGVGVVLDASVLVCLYGCSRKN